MNGFIDFIYHPSDKPDILHARQKIIRDLDKLDKQKLEGDLRELAQYENDVYWFWKKRIPKHANIYTTLF